MAIVLNKEKINTDKIITEEIIPGRAMSITLKWNKNEILTIMNVYAPNDARENRDFWNELKGKTENMEYNKPNIMLGDMNLVEDAIDRILSHTDYGQAVEALGNLRESLGLIDGWRTINPDEKSYSFLQKSTGAQSRIDRIYINQDFLVNTVDWTTENAPIKTDHKMVSVKNSTSRYTIHREGEVDIPTFPAKGHKTNGQHYEKREETT